MDSLRPDRDDLDLYKSRKNKAAAPTAREKAGEQDVLSSGVGKSSGGTATIATTRSAKQGAGQSSGFKWVLFLMLLLSTSG
jgi:hypothetical protein